VYDLRLTAEEFYDLTPRQFRALCERRRLEREHLELLIGINTSATVNTSMAAPKQAKVPTDFMPSRYRTKTKPTKKPRANRKSEQALADDIRAAFKLMGAVEAKDTQGVCFICTGEDQ
jgi:hypothetical protein